MISSIRARSASRELFATFVVCTLLPSLLLGLPVQARSQSPTHNAVEVHKHFQSAIDALAAKWHVAIIAESAPIIEKAGADLPPLQPQETVEQAVARIAAAFDYSVKRKDDMFILNKLFTDPNDLPDLTLEEASAALEEILQILPSIDAKYMPRGGVGVVGAMQSVLTRDELAALDHGGVPVSSLTDDQRTETRRVAEAIQYACVVDDAREAAYFIQGALAHDPEFHWSDGPPEYREFGYDVSIGSRAVIGRLYPITVLKPLSHQDTVKVTSDGLGLSGRAVTETGEPVSDPSEPQEQSAEQVRELAATDRECTLSRIVSRINERAGQYARCTVDEELADKAITVAGDNNAMPAEIASACAYLYGLQARHRTGGGITIARRTPPRVSGPSEINSVLLTAIPDSILRCVAARTTSVRAGAGADQIRSHPWMYGQFNVGQHITAAASRQVRSLAQPLAAASPQKRIALSLLPDGSRTAFAVSQSMEAFISALEMCDKGAPTILLDFDHAVIKGSLVVTSNQSAFTLDFSVTDTKTGQPTIVHGGASILITGGLDRQPEPVQGQ